MIRNSPAKQASLVVTTPGARVVPMVPIGPQTSSANSSPTKLMVPENLTLKQREQIQMALSNYTTPELVVVKMGNGRLKITAKDSIVVDDPIEVTKKVNKSETCIKCKRQIDGEELFFHLPIDPDRRRTWGKILGLSYEKMMSTNSACDTICSDHFTEACLFKYGYNKTSVETHGEPYNTDMPNEEMSSYGSHMNCCIKWQCTLCKFHNRSVIVLREHVLKEHLTGSGERQLIRDLQDNKVNLLCPFCRKTGYGYKTVSGFLKHLQTPPGEHLYLKRIAIKAEAKCRMEFLKPSDKWESWTEDNIVLAMYGALMHKIKRKVPKADVELAAPNTTESKSKSPDVDSPTVFTASKTAEPTPFEDKESSKSSSASPSSAPELTSEEIEKAESEPKSSPSPPAIEPAVEPVTLPVAEKVEKVQAVVQAPPRTTALILKKSVVRSTEALKPASFQAALQLAQQPTTSQVSSKPESDFILPSSTKTGEVISLKSALANLDGTRSPRIFSPQTRAKLGYVDFSQKLHSVPTSPAARRLYREGPGSHNVSPVRDYSLKKSAEAAATRMRLFGSDEGLPPVTKYRLTPKESKIESARLVESPRKSPETPSMPLETFINEAVSAANSTPSKNRKSRDEMKVIRSQQQPAFPVGNPVFISLEDVASNFGRHKAVIKRTYSHSAISESVSSPAPQTNEPNSQPVVNSSEFNQFADRRIISKKARQNLFGYISSEDEEHSKPAPPRPQPIPGQVRQVIVRKAIHGKPPISANSVIQRRIVSLRSKTGLPIPVVDAIHKAEDEVSKLRYGLIDSKLPSEPSSSAPLDLPPPRSITKKIRILRANKPSSQS
ncbi:hypothetical protein L596_016948 [Steinernema carpocapsae]|uniref:THAP-type domain-containing protein n=1 Tax=Steinernema carpocapsae TaxID=34508 RepID=A0A4U5N0D8_STECR|nr:hypothetical protein L596_016948 [Steinernema carpocapsae]